MADIPSVFKAAKADFEGKIQERLETFARQLYDSLASGVSYAGSTIPAWALEANYLISVRDASWMAAYAFLNEVMPQIAAGQRELPAWEEVEALLPSLAWPEGARGYGENA